MSEYEVVQLKNGVRAVRHFVPQSGVAHVAVTIGAGTRDERDEQHGVAHLVEHLLFKGTPTRTAYRISSALESVGGELNAFTSKEETVLHATVPLDTVTKAAELLADIAFRSVFAASEVEKEREVIIDEINSYKDAPSELIFDEFEELLFKGSALGRNILGSKANLKKVGQADLLRFTHDNFVASRVVFAVSSSLTDRQFCALCERVLGRIEIASDRAVDRAAAPVVVEPFSITKNKKLHSAHVLTGGLAYSALDERRIEAALLLNVLGGPTSIAKLNQLLRERHALTYAVEASYVAFADTGMWTIFFSAEHPKIERAMRLIDSELERVSSTKFTDVQLARHKRQFIGQLTLSSENRETMLLAASKSVLLYDKFEANSVVAEQIAALDAERLRTVAEDLFAKEKQSQLIYL